MISLTISPVDLNQLHLAIVLGVLAGIMAAAGLSWLGCAVVDSQRYQDWRDRAYVRRLNKTRGVASPSALVALLVVCLLAACAVTQPTAITGSDQWWQAARARPW